MTSAFSIEFLEPTSEFQTPVTFLLVDRNSKCGYSFSVTLKIVNKKENSKFCHGYAMYFIS